jgi:hypothetical protein
LDTGIDGIGFDADLNIRKEVNLYNEIDAINNIFKLQTEGIIQRIMNFYSSFILIFKTCGDFRQAIGSILQHQDLQNGDETVNIIVQMSEIAEGLFKTITGIKIILDENTEAVSALQQKYDEEYLSSKSELTQKQEVRILSNAFRELNYLNREVLLVLNQKKNSQQIRSDLQESSESVRYYKHFKNEIDTIIHCLNEISDKMKAGDVILENKDKESIHSLHS